MAFERPSPGNPYQLTVNQHIFPARSIERFYGASGTVQVFNKRTGKVFPSGARNPLFCAQRAWNQQAESGFMLEIENKFQPIAEAVLSGRLRNITPLEHHALASMYALWLCRFGRQEYSIPDPVIKMVRPAREYTQVEQEQLEKAGITTIRPDASVPIRHLIGIRMSMEVRDLARRVTGGSWGVLRADDGEFLVPDNFGTLPIIPLSPKVMLAYGDGDTALDRNAVARLNQVALLCASRYIFARDWSEAPTTVERRFR